MSVVEQVPAGTTKEFKVQRQPWLHEFTLGNRQASVLIRPRTYIGLIGEPGSGKSWQTEEFKRLFPDLKMDFREMSREMATRFPETKKTQGSGALVCDQLANGIFYSLILEGDPQIPLWSIGYPRTIGQGQVFHNAAERGIIVPILIALRVYDEDIAIQRILGGAADRGKRDDDKIEVIRGRLKLFRELTLPAIEETGKHGYVVEIDARKSEGEVLQDIVSILTKHQVLPGA